MVFPGDIIWYFLIFLVLVQVEKKTRAGDACIADGGGDDDDDDDVDDDVDGDDNGAVLVGVGFEEVDLHTLPKSTAPKGKLLLQLQSTVTHCTVTLLQLQSTVLL